MTFGLVEMIAVFSIVLAFVIYQLVTVRGAPSEDGHGQARSTRAKETV